MLALSFEGLRPICCVPQNIESRGRRKSGVKPPHSIEIGVTIFREIQ
jgi:hypothetical protein